MESVKSFDPMDELEQLPLYETLVERMGVFRWQGPTGLAKGHKRSLSHLKAKFQNIKEFGYFIFGIETSRSVYWLTCLFTKILSMFF